MAMSSSWNLSGTVAIVFWWSCDESPSSVDRRLSKLPRQRIFCRGLDGVEWSGGRAYFLSSVRSSRAGFGRIPSAIRDRSLPWCSLLGLFRKTETCHGGNPPLVHFGSVIVT